jgi:hypothetical protein
VCVITNLGGGGESPSLSSHAGIGSVIQIQKGKGKVSVVKLTIMTYGEDGAELHEFLTSVPGESGLRGGAVG